MNLQQHKTKNRLKWFLGKISYWGFLGFIKNRCIEFSWFFGWSYGNLKAENWVKLFRQNLVLGFLWQESPKMDLQSGFLGFIRNWSIISFQCFTWNYRTIKAQNCLKELLLFGKIFQLWKLIVKDLFYNQFLAARQ